MELGAWRGLGGRFGVERVWIGLEFVGIRDRILVEKGSFTTNPLGGRGGLRGVPGWER